MSIEKERVTTAGRFPPWIRHEHLARYEFVTAYAPGKDVVDCACGDGTSSRLLSEAGATLVRAFDLSEEAMSQARATAVPPNLVFEAGDATALPLAAASADLYVSLETIEHLPDAHRFLSEVVRVLRPGGSFICSTPDRDVYSPGHTLESHPWNRFHVREYTQDDFAGLLGSYFGRVEMFGQNPKSPGLVALRGRAARFLPGDTMVRLNQAAKLPRYLYDRPEHHQVQPAVPGRRYELLLAVCSAR